MTPALCECGEVASGAPRYLETVIRRTGSHVRGAKRWVLEWRTRVMPVPAFWTFDTKREALAAVAEMRAR